MTKKQRLKELCALIKETYNLDFVTAISTKAQHNRNELGYNESAMYFKMRYRLKGGDIVQMCPISWLVIDANEDALIVKTCGEVLSAQEEIKPVLKQVLSPMAQNAVIRAGNDIIDFIDIWGVTDDSA